MVEGTKEERFRLLGEELETLTKTIKDGAVTPARAGRLIEISLLLDRTRIQVPDEFLCPISKEMMVEPVVISTGNTFDKRSIEEQFAAAGTFFPNNLIKGMISKWCKDNGQRMPEYKGEPTEYDFQFITLLQAKLQVESKQQEAAKELRGYTENKLSYQIAYARKERLYPQLLSSFPVSFNTEKDKQLQEDILTIMNNICSYQKNKDVIGGDLGTYPPILLTLKFGGIESCRLAAILISKLCYQNVKNQEMVGSSGAIKLLIALMKDGSKQDIIKELSETLRNCCALEMNKSFAAEEGVVALITEKISKGICVDELQTLLTSLDGGADTSIESMEE